MPNTAFPLPFLRVIELLLSLGMLVSGVLLTRAAIAGVLAAAWPMVGFLLAGPAWAALGCLGLVHALTGRLPTWATGERPRHTSASSHAA